MDRVSLDRRQFLTTLSACAGGACLGGALGPLTARAEAVGEGGFARAVDFCEPASGGAVRCTVCPFECRAVPNKTCYCNTRINVGGTLYTRAYNNPCIVRIDPIEKMPLMHFRPGSQTLTLATGGCNVRCLYCQNWEQAHSPPDELRTFSLSPAEAVAAARKRKIKTIAFSYTEPTAYLEWAKDVAKEAKAAKLNVVVATSAFIRPEPLLDFAAFVDAFVVSLKGFSEDFYETVLAAQLGPVKEAIKTIRHRTNCWLEIVNLMIPGYNDAPDVTQRMIKWVREDIGVDVPLHFYRFEPMHKMEDVPRTPPKTLETARAGALKAGLQHAYIGNLAPHDGNNTYCHQCSALLVERLGFQVSRNELRNGMCPHCRTKLPGVWK